MKEIDKVLDDNEQIVWEGKPSFLAYVVSGSLIGLAFGFFVLVVITPVLTQAISGLPAEDLSRFWLAYWLIAILLILLAPLSKIISYKFIYYVITDKRVLLQSGIIGRDFQIIDFDKIVNINVDVGLIDKIFGRGSGTIFVATAGFISGSQQVASKHLLQHIANPYEVFKSLKKVSHDIKTDISYPNKLRPEINPGYNTEYKPKHRSHE